jgi:predicted TIM-barrel fold metal-dependent hydrolase
MAITTTDQGQTAVPGAATEPLVVMTSDSHVQPLFDPQLRAYCPKEHLQDFDDWLERMQPRFEMNDHGIFAIDSEDEKVRNTFAWNLQTNGQHDIHTRLRDMDRDGVAAEVIFHGSAPMRPLPLLEQGIGVTIADPRLARVGQHIYNQWLADFCSVEPERHAGLAHLPMWDVDEAIEELNWAREAGLKGVNFPAPRAEIPPYEDPIWDPFWSACEDLGMVLAGHGGGGSSTPPVTGHASGVIYIAESGVFSRLSPLVRLVFGGVLERHPKLKVVQTEQVGAWFGSVLTEIDSIWDRFEHMYDRSATPRRPSEYVPDQYFIGASFQSRHEAEVAVAEGWSGNVMWGSDYPHPEGTYHWQPEGSDETPTTRLAMRNTFSGLPDGAVRNMLGETGIQVYGFDGDKLRGVAARIGAPTLAEIAQPVDERPTHWGFAFRETDTYF